MHDINFFTPYIEARRPSSKIYVNLILVMSLIFGAAAGFYVWSEFKVNSLNKEIKQKEVFLNSEENQAKLKRAKETKKKSEIIDKYSKAIDNVNTNIDKSDVVNTKILDSIRSTLPASVFFKSMSLTPENIQLQCVAASRVSVAEFEHNLKALGMFESVKIPAITNDEATSTGFSFSVTCTMKGGNIK